MMLGWLQFFIGQRKAIEDALILDKISELYYKSLLLHFAVWSQLNLDHETSKSGHNVNYEIGSVIESITIFIERNRHIFMSVLATRSAEIVHLISALNDISHHGDEQKLEILERQSKDLVNLIRKFAVNNFGEGALNRSVTSISPAIEREIHAITEGRGAQRGNPI
ncbi:MAG: hypothetical protein AAF565_00910 [Pseudomonadota bacterium]